jgi:hypothetical protein
MEKTKTPGPSSNFSGFLFKRTEVDEVEEKIYYDSQKSAVGRQKKTLEKSEKSKYIDVNGQNFSIRPVVAKTSEPIG